MIMALTDNLQWLVPLVITLLKSGIIIFAFILPFVSYSVYAERRVSALIQDRLGPNRVGPFGLFQPIPDAIKFLLKEDFTPSHVNKFYFWLAPSLAMIPALLTIAVIPFGSTINIDYTVILGAYEFVITPVQLVVANLDVGLLYVFAISSLSVYGIVIAGWSSNSKYPFLGAIRSTAQLISYEIAMGLAIMPVLLIIGNLNLSEIVIWQAKNGWIALPFLSETPGFHMASWILWIPFLLSFIIFLVAAFAETNRLPFDLPECETELIGGYHTEYSSMRFALFFLGEYAAMIVMSALMVTLFFGGWHFPFLPVSAEAMGLWGSVKLAILHVATFSVKMVLFMLFFIWVRWTLPRFRYDQLMNLGWKVFLPLAVGNLILTMIVLAVLKG